MSGCEIECALFIWLGFLWPLIITSIYLITNKQQISSKGKYFLLSTFGGYALMIGFNFLIAFLANSFLDINSGVEMKTLALGTTIILFIPPMVLSHVLYKKYS